MINIEDNPYYEISTGFVYEQKSLGGIYYNPLDTCCLEHRDIILIKIKLNKI